MNNAKKIVSVLLTMLLLLAATPLTFAATANNDSAGTNEDTKVVIEVLSNDIHETNAAILSVTTPSHGVAVISGNAIEYTPSANFNGQDQFNYVVSDVNGQSTGTVSVQVAAVNDAPVINTGDLQAYQNVAFSFQLNVTDVEGDTITINENASTVDGVSLATISWMDVTGLTITGTGAEQKIHTVKLIVSDGLQSTEKEVKLNVKPIFEVNKVKINDKTNGDFSVEDANTIEVEFENGFTKELENVYVLVSILDVNGEDLSEESDEFDLDSGEDETIEVEFDLSKEDLEEEKYVLEITIEGEDADGKDYATTLNQDVEVNRERHRVVITKASLDSSQIDCAESYTSAVVHIENIGESDEDNVEIKISNTELGLSSSKSGIEIEKYSDNDNEYNTRLVLNLDGVTEGTYALKVEVYRDGNLEDTQELSLNATGSCSVATGTTTTSGSETTADENKINLLQQEILNKLQDRPVQSNEFSLRNSNVYVLLLGFLVVLTFLAIVLALAVATLKRRESK